jgi:ribosomal protein L31E
MMVVFALLFGFSLKPVPAHAQAAEIVKIIQEGIKKVIKAVDLKIQRLQNQTIWLQNAQKAIENTLTKLKLEEISDWVEKQRVLYADYFDELHKVRSIIAYYRKIKTITDRQVQIVEQYKKAYALFKQDDHFTADEIQYMGKVYTGIFDESLKNLDRLFIVINSFTTTMTDAQRLSIIDEVSDTMDQNYFDLQLFNNQNKLLSMQRSKSDQEIRVTKALYGIE